MSRTALEICEANRTAASARRADMRAQFPTCAELLDDLRKCGFERARPALMQENGNTWQRKDYEPGVGVVPMLGDIHGNLNGAPEQRRRVSR